MLEAICILGDPALSDRVAGMLAATPDEVAPLVESLVRSAMLAPVTVGAGFVCNPGLASRLRSPAGLGPPLRTLLRTQPPSLLEEAAAAFRTDAPATGARR